MKNHTTFVKQKELNNSYEHLKKSFASVCENHSREWVECQHFQSCQFLKLPAMLPFRFALCGFNLILFSKLLSSPGIKLPSAVDQLQYHENEQKRGEQLEGWDR